MPFTSEQFFNVFKEYNTFVFPAQIIFLIGGVICVFLLKIQNRYAENFIKTFLIMLWLWIGVIYQLMFFTVINKAAYIFGALFIIQSIFFFVDFFIRKKFVINFGNKLISITGYTLLIFGVIIYPVIGLLVEKNLVYLISLGLPCPSVIFTFGMLVLAEKSLSKHIFIIPVLWATIGFFAAINFGVYQDVALPISALTLFFYKSKKQK